MAPQPQATLSNELDALLEHELAAGATQLLILGAGREILEERVAARLAGITVFECADLDPETDDLAYDLECAGYDRTRRSVIAWSGVSMYLGEAVVNHVLGFAAAHTQGCAVIFDRAFAEDFAV
jgi:O-methyltransferase involved in polyketide biosynthesis